MIELIFKVILTIIVLCLPVTFVAHMLEFKTAKKWKVILKNFDKIKYIEKSYGDYTFKLYQNNVAILRINIHNGDFFARDYTNDDFIGSPEFYPFLINKIYKKLMDLVPDKDKGVIVKDSFENYL